MKHALHQRAGFQGTSAARLSVTLSDSDLNTAGLSVMLGIPHSAVVAAGGFHGCPVLPRAGLGTDAPPSA